MEDVSLASLLCALKIFYLGKKLGLIANIAYVHKLQVLFEFEAMDPRKEESAGFVLNI